MFAMKLGQIIGEGIKPTEVDPELGYVLAKMPFFVLMHMGWDIVVLDPKSEQHLFGAWHLFFFSFPAQSFIQSIHFHPFTHSSFFFFFFHTVFLDFL